jgi:hypothetical protein
MALIHTTTVSLFRQVCDAGAGTLVPQPCSVMGRPLTYFFYGRPAYRPGPISSTDRDLDSRPVCLIFDRSAVHTIVGVYPCDTGAHSRGFYSPFLDGIDFPDLDCISVDDADKRIVSRFFGDNESYFFGQELGSLSPSPTSNVAHAYHDLLASRRVTECDDRSRTIELIQSGNLDLSAALKAIIVPAFLRADPVVAPALRSLELAGIDVLPYRPQSQTSAARVVEQLFPVVGELQGLPL